VCGKQVISDSPPIAGTEGTPAIFGGFPRLSGRAVLTMSAYAYQEASSLVLAQQAHLAVVQNVLGGVSAAAAGLLIATGIRMLIPHCGRPAALLFAALAFGLMIFTKLPLLGILFGLIPLSIAVTGIGNARAR
jgi:chromate transport protein ChrA